MLEIELNGAAVAAVLDRVDVRLKAGEALWTKDLPRVSDYFNAGVLLIDLERWRQQRITERAFEYLRQYPHSPCSDQDALNVACDRAWRQLEPRWNIQNYWETQMSCITPGDGPGIIHFAGRLKPWQVSILHSNARQYDRVRSRTRFARTNRDKITDYVDAPTKYFQSGLFLWQLKRALRRCGTLRRIWRYLTQASQVNASDSATTPQCTGRL